MDGATFWRNVNKLIKSQNTTQEAIAKTCAINFGTFKNRSSKKIVPDAIEAYKIAQALNTTVEYLVTGEDSSPYKRELDRLKAAIIPVLNP